MAHVSLLLEVAPDGSHQLGDSLSEAHVNNSNLHGCLELHLGGGGIGPEGASKLADALVVGAMPRLQARSACQTGLD